MATTFTQDTKYGKVTFTLREDGNVFVYGMGLADEFFEATAETLERQSKIWLDKVLRAMAGAVEG